MNEKLQLLEQIEKEVKICTKCPLYKTANCAVAGTGSPDAKIVFIGEAPGANEDREGIPFVGQAGKLLDKGLNAIKLSRKDIWIGNIIKHRPPNNRDPLPEEVKACKPYLNKQLAIIAPKLIITLGRYALTHFIPESSITRVHGKLLIKDTLNIYPIYHPAAALRNGDFMKSFVQDFLKIPDILEQIVKKNTTNKETRNIQTRFV